MKDRLLWVLASVIVGAAVVVLIAHRSGYLQEPAHEGTALLGTPGVSSGGHIPPGWEWPPPIGEDPDYQGPPPTMPMKMSPYAMATSRRVRRRTLPRDRGDRGMDTAVVHATADVDGAIGYLGGERDGRFDRLGDRLGEVPAELFIGDDAARAADRLREQGFAFLLVSQRRPEPEPWMQEAAAGLRIRLRDGLPLSHFHPLVFGRAHILYRIADPMEFSTADRARITSWVRIRLAGGDPGSLGIERPTDSVGRDEHRVILSLRAHRRQRLLGRRVTSASGGGATVEQALTEAVERIERIWPEERAVAIDDFRVTFPEGLSEAIEEMEVEVEVVDRMCRIIDRYKVRLPWQYEIGHEGLYLDRNQRFFYMSPPIPVWRADQYRVREDGRSRRRRHYDDEDDSLEDFLRDNGLPQDSWQERASEPGRNGRYLWDFGRFDTHHWIENATGDEVIPLYRGVPLVTVAEVTGDSIIEALQLGAMWLVNNQLDDGQFRYKYEPLNVDPDRRWISGNNIVRHALNPYTLLLVNRVAPDPRLVDSARRGLRYTLDHLRRHGDRCYVWHQDVPADYENAKMGTVAVTILSILAMAGAEGVDISEYEDVLNCLAEELLYVQDPNGHFRQYDVPRDHGYYGAENSIFPGEMLLALARMYGYSRDERYREAFERGFGWYTRWWAEYVDNQTSDGIYNEENRMNLVGFVPWNVMALNEMHQHTGEDRYADFAFELQDWMDSTFFYLPERTPYPDYLGAYYKHHWETPAINSNGYTEGAAAAYALALRTGRDVERRRQILVLGVRFALQIQYESYDTTFFLPDPRTAMGGFRYNLNRTRSRNDYSYHAMSALSQALEFLRPQDYPAEHPIPLPRTLSSARGEPLSEVEPEIPAGDAGPGGADAGADGGPLTAEDLDGSTTSAPAEQTAP